jgi:alpha-mannosidase
MKARKKTCFIHMIGHGHIDPTWLWNWEEGFEEVQSTFTSVIQRLNETKEFIFTASSACFYQWIKDINPSLFKEIKKYVKA